MHPNSQAKRTLDVAELSIADDGRLLIRPAEFDPIFEMIWRAAAEMRWNGTLRCFVCPKPREWSYRDWYMHAGAALDDELGRRLVLTSRTNWTNVPDAVRAEIEAAAPARNDT